MHMKCYVASVRAIVFHRRRPGLASGSHVNFWPCHCIQQASIAGDVHDDRRRNGECSDGKNLCSYRFHGLLLCQQRGCREHRHIGSTGDISVSLIVSRDARAHKQNDPETNCAPCEGSREDSAMTIRGVASLWKNTRSREVDVGVCVIASRTNRF